MEASSCLVMVNESVSSYKNVRNVVHSFRVPSMCQTKFPSHHFPCQEFASVLQDDIISIDVWRRGVLPTAKKMFHP
jgi:hypothetical protein